MNKLPDFLTRSKLKILRTVLYGDTEYSPFEIEVVHTPLFQRLYGLKQLGFSDRVFPDAVHSRFNHVLGVVHRTEKMARAVMTWLEQNPKESFTFGGSTHLTTLSAKELRKHINQWLPALRLIALTHDLPHAAFGHTLEDEIHVFEQRHDDPARQAKFFNALVAQLVYIWGSEMGFPSDLEEMEQINALAKTDCLGVDEAEILERVAWIKEELSYHTAKSEVTGATPFEVLRDYLKKLEWAFNALLYLDSLHNNEKSEEEAKAEGSAIAEARSTLLVTRVLSILDNSHSESDFSLLRDAFAIDMIGNTICADLLDYAQRDSHFAGLQTAFDDRLIRYLAIVSVKNKPGCRLCPTDAPYLRLAIQFHANKVRLDVVSEMTQVLRTRYHITESVLLHPTKCAAGAMLGRVVQMLGISRFPDRLLVLGDVEIMRVLEETARGLEALCMAIPNILTLKPESTLQAVLEGFAPYDEAHRELIGLCVSDIVGSDQSASAIFENISRIQSRATAARRVLWNLRARRFPQTVFRIRCGIQISDSKSAQNLAGKYSGKQAREEIERQIEERCDLPMGSVFVHCPRAKTGMKLAQALLFGPDKTNVRYLRDLAALGNKQELKPYQNEVKAIEEMYNSIWKFHIFLDRAQMHKALLVSDQAASLLEFPNDESLQAELEEEASTENPHTLLRNRLRSGDFAPKLLPLITENLGKNLRQYERNRRDFDQPTKINYEHIVDDSIAEANQLPTPRQDQLIPSTLFDPQKRATESQSALPNLGLDFDAQ